MDELKAEGVEANFVAVRLPYAVQHDEDDAQAAMDFIRAETEWTPAVSIGRRPTYYRKGSRLLEAHLLDFNSNLYGLTVLVTLHVHIRPQRRFRTTEELVAQIEDDVNHVRSWGAVHRK